MSQYFISLTPPKSTDVFYAHCTFWTGDWAWLKAANRGRGTIVNGRYIEVPQCPFCGSVGFQTAREVWLRQAREYETGIGPRANGQPHPGYVAMLMWGEKKCFPSYEELERAWKAQLS